MKKQTLKTEQTHNKNDNGGYVFERKLLNKLKCKSKPTYGIGVDAHNKKTFTYCLCKSLDGFMEILLIKAMNKKKEFTQEVMNLSKYFNATIYEEVE